MSYVNSQEGIMSYVKKRPASDFRVTGRLCGRGDTRSRTDERGHAYDR
jgi:hypothetical protein